MYKMKGSRDLFILSFSFVLLFRTCHPETLYSTQINNYINLVTAYYRNTFQSSYNTINFLPKANLSQVMEIGVSLSLYAINDFDEVAGSIELVVGMKMNWTDEIPVINGVTFSYTDRNSMLIKPSEIWTPLIVLTNAVDSVEAVGDESYMCRFNMANNEVIWFPRVIISGSCTPDVTYYPFDIQTCNFIYTAWGFDVDELKLVSTATSWDDSGYDESGEWNVVSTTSEEQLTGVQSELNFTIVIERKPLYFAFNIIFPVLILCLLNGTVFLLPAESGERVGFSVTCFLSFVVLLNMIMEILPRSSSPISYLCYYLVVMMGFSGIMCVITILVLRVYHTPEGSKVPGWLKRFVFFVNCGCCNFKCCRRRRLHKLQTRKEHEEHLHEEHLDWRGQGCCRRIVKCRSCCTCSIKSIPSFFLSLKCNDSSNPNTAVSPAAAGSVEQPALTSTNSQSSVKNTLLAGKNSFFRLFAFPCLTKSESTPSVRPLVDNGHEVRSCDVESPSTSSSQGKSDSISVQMSDSSVSKVNLNLISTHGSKPWQPAKPEIKSYKTISDLNHSGEILEVAEQHVKDNPHNLPPINRVSEEIENSASASGSASENSGSDLEQIQNVVAPVQPKDRRSVRKSKKKPQKLSKTKTEEVKSKEKAQAKIQRKAPENPREKPHEKAQENPQEKSHEKIQEKPNEKKGIRKLHKAVNVLTAATSSSEREYRRHMRDLEDKIHEEEDGDDEDSVTWPMVGRVLDTFFLLAFIGGQIFFTVIFLVPLGTRAS